jgi:hypothetical protein
MTIGDHGGRLLSAAVGLRTALEQTGDALAAPRVATLLESEAALAAALAVLPGDGSEAGSDRDRILRELARARHELQRCRQLGATLHDTIANALGNPADYGADGRRVTDGRERPAGRLQARG